MDSLLVITGPPGAGKSVVAARVAARLQAGAVVRGDHFFDFLAHGRIEPWRHEAHTQNEMVVAAAAASTGHYVRAGLLTIYEGVLGPWFAARFATAAELRRFDYAVLLPPADLCVARLESRSGHRFDDEGVTRRLHREFVDAGIDARHVIDSEGGSDSVADRIVDARRRGELSYEPLPDG